ncbi:hypothetical protein LAG90_08420 [Marinilongibacter aquaticus]|uniref:hypothetical protein n=1 Tax=Marinilongibacter aquaticus TaxID=2975157 RepID=UPI0021BD6326|nr:hypothetical protein [Marinilongibacter aquaticus]UBM60664.1 hypothetical protein LAG90_08420 [Marinilongibacter aquaticus]
MKKYKKIFSLAVAALMLTGSVLSVQANDHQHQAKKKKTKKAETTNSTSLSLMKYRKDPMKNEKHYKTSAHALKLETSSPHGKMEQKTISRHYKLKYSHVKEDLKVSMKPENKVGRNYKRPHSN